jgi:hypothetical protein
LELSGFSNILSKIIGSNNPLNNAIATINALTSFKVDVDNVQKVVAVVKEKVVEKGSNPRGDRKPVPRTPAKKSTTNSTEVA